MTTQDILLLLSLGIIVLWTTRLARTKGLNPWLWGIGSVLLITFAWNFSRQFLGPVVMIPLVILLLYRSPLFSRNRTPEPMPCPNCGAPDTGGLNFCVQCGWELSRTPADTPEGEGDIAPTAERSADSPPPVNEVMESDTVDQPAPDADSDASTELTAEEESVPEPVLAQESVAEPPESAAASPPAPPAPPRRPPTAASLTERGIAFLNQGRFQEAIDQFTKAIALDPKYREALQHRAEAYGRLGRPERQEADLHRLEAI